MQKLIRFSALIAILIWLPTITLHAQQDVGDKPKVGDKSDIQDDTQETSVESKSESSFLFDGSNPKNVDQLRMMEAKFAQLTKKLFPATVNIQINGSQGTGVVVTSDGYILTAAHVIGGPGKTALVTFPDKRRFRAETLGVNIGSIDSGMLKIKNPKGLEFDYIDLAISDDVKKGQWVMAVGHPGGLDFSRGLVARVGRIVSKSKGVMVSDCTLVGGDSGGPLIDMNGDLVGIHSRIGGSLSQNLHVPVDQFTTNWDKLAEGWVLSSKGRLGVDIVDDSNKVASVTEKKAAAKAGIKKGDLFLKIAGKEVKAKQDIGKALSGTHPNQTIEVVISRKGKQKTLKLKLGQ